MVAALKAVGYGVWYDESGLAGGDAWVASIQREVQACDVFLLILTPDAWTSPWVQDELQLAIATRRRILPVLLRNTQVDGFILTTQWVTVVGEEPQVAARSVILAIETPPAPGRGAVPQAPTETLDDLLTLCQSLQAEGRYTEALSACDRALALDPDNLDVLLIKMRLLDRIQKWTSAGAIAAHALSLLNPSNADGMTIAEISESVIGHSDDAEAIVKAYRMGYDKSGRNLAWVIGRLAALGHPEYIPNQVAEYQGDDAGADVMRVLAQAGQVDTLMEFGARMPDLNVTFAATLASIGRMDDMMRVAAQVADARGRDEVLGNLEMEKHFESIDRLCRLWFGYPPPSHPPRYASTDPYRNIYFKWSRALAYLGLKREAAVVYKIAELIRL